MFEKTLADITAYIDALRAHGYAVTVSDLDKVFEPTLATFIMYELSPLPLCDYLRNHRATKEQCLSHRAPFVVGEGELHHCRCHAGVEEFTLPIRHNDAVIACVHVTGYRDRASAGEELLAKFAGSEDEGRVRTLYSALCADLPDTGAVLALLRPLSYMLERLYDQCCEYTDHSPAMDAYSKSLLYIRDHYMEGITVSDVARGIGYSVSYFGYLFKRNRGISANRYISELKLAKATELLRGTAFSVSDIAERVGFGDANYFSTAFKEKYGLSPRQYRAKQR